MALADCNGWLCRGFKMGEMGKAGLGHWLMLGNQVLMTGFRGFEHKGFWFIWRGHVHGQGGWSPCQRNEKCIASLTLHNPKCSPRTSLVDTATPCQPNSLSHLPHHGTLSVLNAASTMCSVNQTASLIYRNFTAKRHRQHLSALHSNHYFIFFNGPILT